MLCSTKPIGATIKTVFIEHIVLKCSDYTEGWYVSPIRHYTDKSSKPRNNVVIRLSTLLLRSSIII